MSLNTRTVLVTLNVSQWTARKFDRNVTAQTNNSHGATEDAGRFNKQLLHKDALNAVQRAVNNARTYHYNNTLDWREATGTRILPLKKIPNYTAFMRRARMDFDRAVEAFLVGYPNYVESARARLGDMFDITDFPEIDDVKKRFTFEHRISPVPTSDDFRIQYPADELDQIKADLTQRLDVATRHATADLYNRTSSVLDTLYQTLRDPNRRMYRTTLHDNIICLLEQIRDMNFDEDAKLTKIAGRIDADLSQLDADAIRKDDAIRRLTLGKVDSIIRDLGSA
jgi:hypothetical protein